MIAVVSGQNDLRAHTAGSRAARACGRDDANATVVRARRADIVVHPPAPRAVGQRCRWGAVKFIGMMYL